VDHLVYLILPRYVPPMPHSRLCACSIAVTLVRTYASFRPLISTVRHNCSFSNPTKSCPESARGFYINPFSTASHAPNHHRPAIALYNQLSGLLYPQKTPIIPTNPPANNSIRSNDNAAPRNPPPPADPDRRPSGSCSNTYGYIIHLYRRLL
jgi:hypothetical protein